MKTKMTKEQIQENAPSVFTKGPSQQMSDKYTFIPTTRVIEDMETLGWNVVGASEIKSRKGNGYQKHMLVFQHPDLTINGENGDDVFPQVLMTNSHNGSSSFQFRVGLYRLVCSNGLVVATQEFENVKVRHMGYSFDELQQTIKTITERLPLTVESMNKMKEIELEQDQMVALANQMLEVRFGDSTKDMGFDIDQILEPVRVEDQTNDLWTVFNRIQERIIGGDFNYSTNNRIRKARRIKNFNQDIDLNQDMFRTALELVEM
jgi:hypothetical protein